MKKKRPEGTILVIGAAADLTAAVLAALVGEGYRACQVMHGATARRLPGECYEADLSSPESVGQLYALVKGTEAEPIRGVFNVLGLESAFRFAGPDDSEMPMTIAAWTFHIVKEFADELQDSDGWFVNVTALDGHFGLGEAVIPSAAASGTLGIVKTLRREYPRLRVKNIDVEPEMPADMLTARLLQELTVEDDRIEVGLTRQGRWRPALKEEAVPRELPLLEIDRDSVILATGGACGITAAIARQLAVEVKPRLILVGRSPLPAAESLQTRGLDRAALRRLFLDETADGGEAVVPAEIERRVHRLMKEREIRATLDACTAAGAAVEYHALDVREGQQFGEFIDGLYERFGRLDGVIHGAGIVADRRIRDKTLDSFAAVFRTKVDSAWTLVRKLRMDRLKFLAFFGSVSGRFGNAGQVDYSAANEMLNKLADQLHRRWPGRVVCINWGPWQGGMVSDDLRRMYAAAGVELISVEEGVSSFLAEIRQCDRRGAEVVLGRGIKRLGGTGLQTR